VGSSHPSQKPLKVIEHLVSCLAPVDGIILDGFAGAGTTALACKNMKRKFIAFEISEEYCKIARTRLEG
jgi:DNA modification methylase